MCDVYVKIDVPAVHGGELLGIRCGAVGLVKCAPLDSLLLQYIL